MRTSLDEKSITTLSKIHHGPYEKVSTRVHEGSSWSMVMMINFMKK